MTSDAPEQMCACNNFSVCGFCRLREYHDLCAQHGHHDREHCKSESTSLRCNRLRGGYVVVVHETTPSAGLLFEKHPGAFFPRFRGWP